MKTVKHLLHNHIIAKSQGGIQNPLGTLLAGTLHQTMDRTISIRILFSFKLVSIKLHISLHQDADEKVWKVPPPEYLLGPAHSSGHPNDPWPRQMYYAHSSGISIGITSQLALSKGQCLSLVINNIAFYQPYT